jgi:hypothetical protein
MHNYSWWGKKITIIQHSLASPDGLKLSFTLGKSGWFWLRTVLPKALLPNSKPKNAFFFGVDLTSSKPKTLVKTIT